MDQSSSRTTWIWQGIPVATYYPEARALLAQRGARSQAFPETGAFGCGCSSNAGAVGLLERRERFAGVRNAERRLLRSLRQRSDGYLRGSIVFLYRRAFASVDSAPVTPNVITAVSLLIGSAAWRCWQHDSVGRIARRPLALGELSSSTAAMVKSARAQGSSPSPFGARFDVVTDDVLHLATFVAMPSTCAAARPDLRCRRPGRAPFIRGVMVSIWRPCGG